MKTTFEKQTFNQEAVTESDFVTMFNEMGFNPSKIEICFTNGCSAYITVNVKVLNTDKMYADVFIYDNVATLTVRVSDHDSNLEKICGGVSGNKLSIVAFTQLVKNNVIEQN